MLESHWQMTWYDSNVRRGRGLIAESFTPGQMLFRSSDPGLDSSTPSGVGTILFFNYTDGPASAGPSLLLIYMPRFFCSGGLSFMFCACSGVITLWCCFKKRLLDILNLSLR